MIMRVRKWIWLLIHIILPKNEQGSIGLREEGIKPWRWVIKEQFDAKQLSPDAQSLSLAWETLGAAQRKCAQHTRP